MNSACDCCKKTKTDFQARFCATCEAERDRFREKHMETFPETSSDALLYLTREHMAGFGWHPRSGWSDPRAHGRTTR